MIFGGIEITMTATGWQVRAPRGARGIVSVWAVADGGAGAEIPRIDVDVTAETVDRQLTRQVIAPTVLGRDDWIEHASWRSR